MDNIITIGQLQEIYLDMLQQFHTFCVENQLTYYMVGGTLLGAVREKGFIPWDDDVDVAMPRTDYERFIREYAGKMDLHSIHTDSKYAFPYVKLFHGDIQVVHIVDDVYGVNSKVFVKLDIYPVDGLGNNQRKAQRLLKTVSQKKKMLFLNVSRYKSQNLIKRAILSVVRWIPTKWIIKDIDCTMKCYWKKASTFNTRWREGTTEPNLFSADVFDPPILLDFEDRKFYAPQKYKTYLTKVYGNFMVECRENIDLRHQTDANSITAQLAAQFERK